MTDDKGIPESETLASEGETPESDAVREPGPYTEPHIATDLSGADDAAVELEELRVELDELNDRHLRLAAEFDNYRKRSRRDREAMATRLQADLVSELLAVLDDLQRVEESGAGTGAESVLEGVRLVEKKFLGVLGSAGLEPVPAKDRAFDPEQMEAIATVPTDDPDLDHVVADVFQRGYRFRSILIRPARVRVWQYEEQESE